MISNRTSKNAATERAKQLAKVWPSLETSKQQEFVGKALRRVTIGQTEAWIEIDKTKLLATLLGRSPELSSSRRGKPDVLKLAGYFQVVRRGSENRVITPQGDSDLQRECVPSLVKVVARARGW